MRSCLGRNLLSGAAEGAAENGVSSGLEYLTSGEPVTVGGLARAVGGGALDGALDGASSAALEKATGTARYGCFTPTTPVLMADGTTRPIKDVRPGDRVASRDPATGRLVAATVDRTHTHARVPTIRLTTTSGTVTTTATHPVHVAGRGYVPAGSLRAGDTLTTPGHAPVHVVSVQATGHTTTVHNLTIRHTHNYHVHTTTKQAILVHNNGTNKTPGACDPPEPEIPETLYHYTNEQGMNAILESGQLNPSLKALKPNDARYGDGQYLTDILPGTKTDVGLARALLGFPWPRGKYTHYIEVDVSGLDVNFGRKNVYVVPGQEPLDISSRTVSYGAN